MDFGRPNIEIGQKMANGQLLFLALQQPAHTNIYMGVIVSQRPEKILHVRRCHFVSCDVYLNIYGIGKSNTYCLKG